MKQSHQDRLITVTKHHERKEAYDQDHKFRSHHIRQDRAYKKTSSRLKSARQLGQ
ncbi:MAG: hypothetical protein M3R69_00090 [Acidobacteriota bacterium]|nr:hypothetical protein [Acidobacteriota bacterium]